MAKDSTDKDFVKYSDETSMREIIIALWDGKWLILSVLVVAIAISFLYLYQVKNTFSASLVVKPVDLDEVRKYTPLNYFIGEFNSKVKVLNEFKISQRGFKIATENIANNKNANLLNENIAGNSSLKNNFAEDFHISARKLLTSYLDNLQDKILWEEAYKKVTSSMKSDFDSPREYDAFVRNLALSSSVVTYAGSVGKVEGGSTFDSFINETDPIAKYPVIHFDGYGLNPFIHNFDVETYIQALNIVTNIAHKRVRKSMISQYDRVDQSIRTLLAYEVEDLKNEIKNAYDDYEINVRNRLEFLKEQRLLATALGIVDNNLVPHLLKIEPSKEITPYYLRGYRFIEEEINVLKGRQVKAAFIPGVIELKKIIRRIEQDDTLERLNYLIAQSPLSEENDDFKASMVDLDALQVRHKHTTAVVITAFTFLGFLLGTCLLVVRNSIRGN